MLADEREGSLRRVQTIRAVQYAGVFTALQWLSSLNLPFSQSVFGRQELKPRNPAQAG